MMKYSMTKSVERKNADGYLSKKYIYKIIKKKMHGSL